jgi:hypothetical protein
MSLSAALLTLVAALLAAGAAAAAPGGATFPCGSPVPPTTLNLNGALQPNLVPNPQLLANSIEIWHDPQTGQYLLAFSAGIENNGAGVLNIVGHRDPVGQPLPDPNEMPAYQRISYQDGSCVEVGPIGTLIYDSNHHHWHLEGMEEYTLTGPDGSTVSHKQAFCLADVTKVEHLGATPVNPVYNGCDPNQGATFVGMGISVGWEDIYSNQLFGQNFDVTTQMGEPQAQYCIQQNVTAAGVTQLGTGPKTATHCVTLGLGVQASTGLPRPGV